MKWFDLAPASLSVVLLSAGTRTNTRPTCWLIDGNNLKGQRPVPSDRDLIKIKLEQILSVDSSSTAKTSSEESVNSNPSVVLVFDGMKGESPSRQNQSFPGGATFETIITPGGESADDFMVAWLQEHNNSSKSRRVVAVTADKELQRRLITTGRLYENDGSILHPLKFWVNTLPNLIDKRTKKKG